MKLAEPPAPPAAGMAPPPSHEVASPPPSHEVASPLPHKPTFNDLYERHARTVLHGIAGFGVRGADRFDIAQDAWVRIYRQLDSFRDENERAWVGSAARAAWLDWRRTHSRRPELDLHTDDEPSPDTRTPEAAVLERESIDMLAALLERFVPNEDQRQALVMLEVFGWQVAEIADKTGVSVTTVQGRIRMARTKLEKALTAEEREKLVGILPVMSATAFLDALRSSATDEHVAELRARLGDLLPAEPAVSPPAAPATAPSSPSQGSTAPAPELPVGHVLTGKQIGMGAVGFFALGAVVATLLSPRPASGPAPTPAIVIEAPRAALGVGPAPESAGASAEQPATTTTVETRHTPVPPSVRRGAVDAEWESETLLGRARGYLVQAPSQAIALTDEHARRFPKMAGAERELIAIRALAKLGRRDEAEARGRRLQTAAAWTLPELRSVLGATF